MDQNIPFSDFVDSDDNVNHEEDDVRFSAFFNHFLIIS